MKKRAYWILTALLAFFIGIGGAAEFTSVASADAIVALGYPEYFVKIIAFWKMLAAIAILVPRFPRLKEWAYAGIFFNMTGAAVSTIVSGSELWHPVVELSIAAMTIASWALRPPSRVLGEILRPGLA
jgi:hypothetical protein